jgi:hypothetical protein
MEMFKVFGWAAHCACSVAMRAASSASYSTQLRQKEKDLVMVLKRIMCTGDSLDMAGLKRPRTLENYD